MAKLDHVNIVVADLERAARFYEHLFGWTRGFEAELKGEWIEKVTAISGAHAHCLFLQSPDGGARIELIHYIFPASGSEENRSLPHTTGARHIAFEVENIDETLQRLNTLGLRPLGEVVEVPFRVANLGTKRLVYFLDFDGVLIEAASYTASENL